MTLVNAEQAARPGGGLQGRRSRQVEGFLDCRGVWQPLEAADEATRVLDEGRD
ncbi:hypothetical protein [Nocardioides sp. SYSU DS0663]|uniref:hypothetical protein n=1 Tax=Nocardioides sp. SYSU DS0663 TaxID=3416445 RepID=UPI003F4C1236